MRKYRTYHPDSLEGISFPSRVELSDGSFQHLIKVLRLKEGEEIHLVDGSGGHYIGDLVEVAKKKAWVEVREYKKADNESPLHLHLVQAISRNDKMDLTIQKAVELGVKEITPLFTSRCGVSLSGDRLAKKVEHWKSVIISACLQSYRDTIPTLNPPMTFDAYIKELAQKKEEASSSDRGNQDTASQKKEIFVNLNPFSGQRLKDLSSVDKVHLLIGSEGGLSDQEIAQALEIGYQDYNLGPRVLRTETAGLTAISIIQAILGDL